MLDGQTGTGKTYTMFGPADGGPADQGIVPRAIEHLFRELGAVKDAHEVS